jgi:hypothetical protein
MHSRRTILDFDRRVEQVSGVECGADDVREFGLTRWFPNHE